MNKQIRFIVKAAVIAALYATITLVLAPISYGELQVRLSEALMILPFFTPAAIPGLFLGCAIANLGSPFGILDIVVGSMATLIAAIITSKIKKPVLVPLPTIIVNAVFVPFVLWYSIGLPYFITMLWVGLGEAIALYAIGYPILLFINKNEKLKNLLKG
jgi:uncharacterized membrane protein